MKKANELLKQTMLADEFRNELIDLGEDEFVRYTEIQTNRTIKLVEEDLGEIQIPICFYEDEDGNKVYDFEAMAEGFENELSKLDESVVVMCSIENKENE